jgi:uncharacterized small protein (DUF1192 family)
MAIEEEDKPRRKTAHEIGQDLSALSVEELAERIEVLKGEIARLTTALTMKRATRDAADKLFKA